MIIFWNERVVECVVVRVFVVLVVLVLTAKQVTIHLLVSICLHAGCAACKFKCNTEVSHWRSKGQLNMTWEDGVPCKTSPARTTDIRQSCRSISPLMHLRTTTLATGVESRRAALQKHRKVYRNNGTRHHVRPTVNACARFAPSCRHEFLFRVEPVRIALTRGAMHDAVPHRWRRLQDQARTR